jgi:hypothetical protein
VAAAARRGHRDRRAGLRVPSRWLALLSLLSLLAVGCAGLPLIGSSKDPAPPLRQSMSAQWYEANAPLVQEYLAHQPDSARGKALAGIPLSDGTRWFEGDVYLGRRLDIAPGLIVVLLERESERRAYLWLEEGSDPMPLLVCHSGDDEGIRARRLGGAMYAWRELRPEHGIVVTICPPAEWLVPAS